MVTATATEVQNNFGKYLKLVQEGQEVIILRNGFEVARLISKEQTISFLSDSLVGIIQQNVDEKAIRKERMSKYDSLNTAETIEN